MKSWIKRFGMLAVLGVIAGSALVAGCGNSEPADDGTAPKTEEGAPPAEGAATPAEPAEGGEEG